MIISRARLKLALIHFFDRLDARLLRCRFHSVCQLIGLSSWWGDHDCLKSGCVDPVE